ncbi:MAG: molybdopterin dinucleotide binding domain-containing protein, partial [Verrucomicrobiota bacterium]
LEPREEVLLLPARTRYEQDDGGTETSTERRVMFTPEIPRLVGEARAEWKILRELAAATWPERAHLLGCETGWALREEIARVVPFYDGIQHLRKTGDAFQYGGERLGDGGRFATADGRAHFKVVEVPAGRGGRPASASGLGAEPGGAHPTPPPRFVVSTRRGKQFNTLIYAERDPLTGADRDAVFLSEADARALALQEGDPVVLTSDTGRYEGRAFLAPLAPGNLQVHWPEGNVLIPTGVTDPVGGVPDYNATVTLARR